MFDDQISEFLHCFMVKSWLNPYFSYLSSYLFLANSINFSSFGRPPFLENFLAPPKQRQVCPRRRRRPPCRWRSSCCGTWTRWERRQRGVAWRGNRGPINKQMKRDGNNNDNIYDGIYIMVIIYDGKCIIAIIIL